MTHRLTMRRKYSEEIHFAIGVVVLFIVMFALAFYYRPAMISQALTFATGKEAGRNTQMLKLPHMALDLRDQRELTVAISIEVPDTGSKQTLDGNKAKLKTSIREIIAEHSSGDFIGGNGRYRLKNDIAYAASKFLPPGTSVIVYISDFHVN